MAKPTKVMKKAFEVETMRWDGTEKNALEIVTWIIDSGEQATYHAYSRPGEEALSRIEIITDEGSYRVFDGHYVVREAPHKFDVYSRPTFLQKFMSVRAYRSQLKLIDELSKHVCEGTPND